MSRSPSMSAHYSRGKNEPLPELVLVLGKTGVGKSTFIKKATGLDVEIGDGLLSCNSFPSPLEAPYCSRYRSFYKTNTNRHEKKGTPEVQIYPVLNSHTFLIDTPGFDDPQRSDTDILQSIASCLADLYEGLTSESAEISLSGIIYIHAIDELRMTGPMMKNLRMLLHLAGNENMQHLVLTTSKWGVEDAKIPQDRERELTTDAKYWKDPLAAGARMRRYDDSQPSALSIIASPQKAACSSRS